MEPGPSLPEVLRRRAAEAPDERAYVWLGDGGEEEAELTHGALHARALAVAAALADTCPPGSRALLVFPPGLDFVVAWFGCLYAQVIAVPVNPPRKQLVQGATRSIVRDCEPAAVLTLSPLVDFMRSALEPVCGPLRWLAVDAVDGDAAGFEPRPCPPDAVAFLQYTSGSTSDPKGVMVTHGNLSSNEEMIRRVFGRGPESTVVGWAPMFHDQGLIGNVLQPLWSGSRVYLMSPLTFVKRPMLWLAAISRYRAHSSGGPNFAFEVCVARVRGGGTVPDGLDLSSWRTAFNGAEPISAGTLRRFTETFAPFGFREEALYPCYGLAEATLIVAGSVPLRGPRTLHADVEELSRGRLVEAAEGEGRALVGSGRLMPEERVRIVDPETGRPCAPDEIGEIWVSGPHVAKGYWRREEATAATFGGRLDDEPGRTFLRTGDLGAVVDGELYVVGRIKDVIIIRGRNYYPHDIERTAERAHPALRKGACAAFAVPAGDGDGEQLVVVKEVKPGQGADPVDVAGAIREAIIREHDLTLGALVLTTPHQLEKTTSGKIMRAAARRRHLEGAFELWGATSLVDGG